MSRRKSNSQGARAITRRVAARAGWADAIRAMVVAGMGGVWVNLAVAATAPSAASLTAAANSAGAAAAICAHAANAAIPLAARSPANVATPVAGRSPANVATPVAAVSPANVVTLLAAVTPANVATPLAAANPMRPPGDPNILWRIVHDKCAPAQAADGKPGPCELVDPEHRYAVLKDIRGDTRFLLLPTDPIAGIESAALLQPGALNYWRAAWAARRYVEARAGRSIPRELLGLTVNSVFQRTQNQLHIHIDCVSPALREALVQHAREFSERWPTRAKVLAGRLYYVMKIMTPDVETDPFQQLAQRLSHPATDMGGQSLSLIGARFADGRPGFYLLDSPAGIHGGTSEDTLDRSCAVLHAAQGSTAEAAPTPASPPVMSAAER